MNTTTKKTLQNHNDVLESIAQEIDIPESLDNIARKRYQLVGEWLDRPNSSIKKFFPEVYPQGSFLLGTVIRPIGDADEFDIDLVCKLFVNKQQVTMASLKKKVGYELIEYAKRQGMQKKPEDGRRCWTLEYADSANFHMDILPALPDEQKFQRLLEESRHRVNREFTREAIAITDKTLAHYNSISDDWPLSNPRGYAVWFESRQTEVINNAKRSIMEGDQIIAFVGNVPDYKVKTPLQRAIQLLKRHRDTMFEGDDNKPISIIITTLAAHAYNGESTIGGALRGILRSMEYYIENVNNTYRIPNPVNPNENFADKWVESPSKATAFFDWLRSAQRDFGIYLTGDFRLNTDVLKKSLTERTLEKVIPLISHPTSTELSSSDRGLKEANRIISQGGQTRPWLR